MPLVTALFVKCTLNFTLTLHCSFFLFLCCFVRIIVFITLSRRRSEFSKCFHGCFRCEASTARCCQPRTRTWPTPRTQTAVSVDLDVATVVLVWWMVTVVWEWASWTADTANSMIVVWRRRDVQLQSPPPDESLQSQTFNRSQPNLFFEYCYVRWSNLAVLRLITINVHDIITSHAVRTGIGDHSRNGIAFAPFLVFSSVQFSDF